MHIEYFFRPTTRYEYDNGRCTSSKFFAQVDTYQDASYFGVWANPKTFTIITYAEGDHTIEIADDAVEFIKEIRKMQQCYQGGRFGIDPGFNPELKQAFVDLGLGDLLH